MTLTAELEDDGNNSVPWPPGVTVAPLSLGAEAQGGFDLADLQADGPPAALWALLSALGKRLRIRRDGSALWAGMVNEVILNLGAIQVGLTLKGMYNRVAVAYSYDDAAGDSQRATTSWAEDAESIARYGYSELLFSLSNVTQMQAEKQRDTLLANFGKPLPILQIVKGSQPSAIVRAEGLMKTLGRRYYSQPAGLEEHPDGGGQQPLGQGGSGTNIGFTQDGRIHDFGNRLSTLAANGYIQVTGSASNNGAHLLESSGTDGEPTYTATSIYFDPTDNVHDSAAGLSFLSDNDIITITGSAGNSGTRRVKSSGSDHMTVSTPPNIVYELPGPSVSITQAGSVRTASTLVNELPGASVTLVVHGQKVAQSFSLAANTSWTVNKVAVRVQKVGAPADSVKVELCANSGSVPGTVLASGTKAASGLYERMEWHEFDLGNTATIAYGSTYWIVLSRTGANSLSDFYNVGVDEETGYSRGVLRLWTGSTWVNRYTDADLSFRVLGAWETTKQIQEIYNQCNQFFAALDIVDASGISSYQYREGDQTGLDEMMKLLEGGSSSGRRLLATSTAERVLRVKLQEVSSADNLLLSSDGTVRSVTGRALPEGWLPAGKWVRLTDVPGNVDALARLANLFIERAEYTADDGLLRLEPLGMPSPWDVGKIVQG